MVKIDEFLIIGCGSIARSFFELLNHEKHDYLKYKITCLCPEDIPEYVYKIKPDLYHIKKTLTEQNMDKIITNLISPSCFVVNLSVNVDSKIGRAHV